MGVRAVCAVGAFLLVCGPLAGRSTAAPVEAPPLTVTYLANEGVVLRAGDTAVAVDAFFGAGLVGYPAVPLETRRALEAAEGEYAGLDLVLATHAHADHFDAAAVARHLAANPDALFVSTPEAVAALLAQPESTRWKERARALLPAEGARERVEWRGATVVVMRMHHGRKRARPIENLGFLVTVGGQRVLHVGDTEASVEELHALGLAADGVDLALLPYWRVLTAKGVEGMWSALAPRAIAAFHLPAPDAPAEWFSPHPGLEALKRALQAAGLTVLADPGSRLLVARLRGLETPAGPGSGQPNLATLPDGRVLLTWIEPAGEGRHALRFAARKRGEPWGPARTVAEGSDWFVNWADVPSLAALPDGSLFAHWLVKSGPGPYAYDVHVSVSRDGGATWSPPVVPHRDGTRSEHGFVSLVPRASGVMDLVWLDGRATGGGHHGGEGGAMSLAHTTMGGDGRLGEETILDARVCDCCQTDAVASAGTTLVVYRDRSPGEVRDTSVVRLIGGRWSSPATVAADGWRIEGCPVNGPAVAARGAAVAVAWFTAPEAASRVKLAFSRDSGATFAPPVVVDDGRPLGRVDVVMLGGEEALVSWLEHGEDGATLRVRRVGGDGTRGPSVTVAGASAARASGFPRLAESEGEVTIAWRDAETPTRVRSAVLAP